MQDWMVGLHSADWVTALSSAALALFAAVQLLMIYVQVLMARRERRERLRGTFAAAWAEYWKIQTTADLWGKQDLVREVGMGVLNADDLMPFDPPGMARLLGDLGMQCARFGGLAMGHVLEARKAIAVLKGLSERRKRPRPGTKADLAKREEWYDGASAKLQDRIRLSARRASETLEDALASAPRWLKHETYDFRGLKSEAATKLRGFYRLERVTTLRIVVRDIREWVQRLLRGRTKTTPKGDATG